MNVSYIFFLCCALKKNDRFYVFELVYTVFAVRVTFIVFDICIVVE